MAHLLEASIMNLYTLLKHEATNGLQDNKEKKQQSLEELAEIAHSLASWSSKYSPNKMSWEEADKQHLTMAKVLKGAVRSIPGGIQ
jgi:hypothetical protein|tara:strand:+ start:258 stop:515 length:258 start_codon:yes stop_codon:yes gene_type:complete